MVMGLVMQPKQKQKMCKDWLAAVGSIDDCVLCGSNYMLQVAHRNMGRGKGQKAPDYETARLCQ